MYILASCLNHAAPLSLPFFFWLNALSASLLFLLRCPWTNSTESILPVSLWHINVVMFYLPRIAAWKHVVEEIVRQIRMNRPLR